MAGPGGREVGRVSIRVLPDVSKFATSLEAYLERTERRLELNLPVSLDQGDVAKVESQLVELTRDRTINLDVDSAVASIQQLGSTAARSLGRIPVLVAAIGAAIGVAAVGLPAILASIAAPIAAIAVGLDGIKKAAEVLQKPFEHLQKVVSAVFEHGLAPAMHDVVALIRALAPGLTRLATSLSDMFSKLVDAFSFSAVTGQLDSILNNVATTLDKLAPAIGPFVNSMLLLADAGTKAFAAMAPALTSLTKGFTEMLATAQTTGVLDDAMRGLGIVIVAVAATFAALVGAMTAVLAVIGLVAKLVVKLPGLISSAWSAVKAATVAAWNATTAAVSTAVAKVVSLIVTIPAKVTSFVLQLGSIGKNAASAFGSGLLGVLDAVVGKVRTAIANIVAAFAKALKLGSPSRLMRQYGQWTGEGFELGMRDALSGVERAAMSMADSPIHATVASRLLPASAGDAQGAVRPIYAETGALIGRLHETIDGRARLVLGQEVFAAGMVST